MPKQWKLAKVTPIQKIKGNEDSANQRPISLLPILSKMLEKVVFNQLYYYVETYKILSDHQNGSRKRQSTERTLLKVTDDIDKATDQGEVTVRLTFDITKAYDYQSPTISEKAQIHGNDAKHTGMV